MHRDGADAARRDRGPDRAQAEVVERGLDEWILIAAPGGRLCRFLSRDDKGAEQHAGKEQSLHVGGMLLQPLQTRELLSGRLCA